MDAALAIGLDTLSYVLALLLVTLGLVVIYGMMDVINMAHGELFLVGAYTLAAVRMNGGSFWLGLALAPVVVALLGLLIEEIVIRHVYHRSLDTILATWGVSIGLKQAIVVLFGPAAISVASPLPGATQVFGVPYPTYRLFIMATGATLAAITYFAIYATPLGLQIRAVIANRAMAGSLGVNTRLMDRATFAAGAGLAGLAGAVMAPIMSVDPQMGVGFLIPAFLAVLVGGLNSLVGAIVGAGVIGGASTTLSNGMSQAVAQIAVFALAIVIIRLFPSGLVRGRR